MPRPGERVVREIREAGGEAIFVEADVSKKPDNEKVAAAALEAYGRIDILVHNAGIFWEVMLDDMTEDDWDRCHNLNLKGTLFATQAVLPAMKRQRHGRILVTSSITGPQDRDAGLRPLRRDQGRRQRLYPQCRRGTRPLRHHRQRRRAGQHPDRRPGRAWARNISNTMTKAIPLGKLGDPEDVAYAMAFFASDEAGWITGQTLAVDGGQTLPESGQAG